MDKTARAIEKTIRYADLFNFPMREEELRQYLIGAKAPGRTIPVGNYRRVRDFFILPGREDLISLRQKKVLFTQKKIVRAINLAHLLRIFPGVRLVGITGSVAASNAGRSDDIDLMIVTAKGRIWLTRALILLAMSWLGLKRPDRESGHFDDQFCFNLWLEDSVTGLRMKNEDLYTAYEVCLMKPLLGSETYFKFMKINDWRRQFLPNFNPSWGLQLTQDSRLIQDLGHLVQYLLESPTLHLFGSLLEPVAKWVSKRRIAGKHARRYHTDVTITDRQLLFHPASPRKRILEKVSSLDGQIRNG
jgi:predicted nucleotidyltransferase